jgi:SAM-dependent methyltransferase
VQKPASEDWLREATEIYAGYEIYIQGGGVEQSSFDPTSGVSTARSQKIVSWLTTSAVLPESGNLLDVGCGNGAFLRAFGARYPRWQMTGLELDDKYQVVIKAIPGVKRLHVGSLENLDDRFDLIVLIHTLEHIPDPVAFLKMTSGKLYRGGRLLIEVPDLETSPFDLLIADHCTHFTTETLHAVVAFAGFDIASLAIEFLPKELSLLAQWPGQNKTSIEQSFILPESKQSLEKGEKIANFHIAWLQNLLQQGQKSPANVGIFGTSISASWLAASLGEKVTFFVDEDSNRVGSTHMGRPIFDAISAPRHSPILMPLRPDIAVSIANRFANHGHKFVPPPSN